MRIAHVEISAPFIDNWGYQENLLPKYLQKTGVDNHIIASANIFPTYLKKDIIDDIKAKGNDYFIDGIRVRRLLTKKVSSSFLFVKGLMRAFEEIKPDVIFHHNFNCTTMLVAVRYARNHNIPLVCDNHADIINMSRNKLWVWFYYKLLIRGVCLFYKKRIYKAYGVTRSRCDFIHDYYGLSHDKIEFLPIGADVDLADTISPISDLRLKYNYDDSCFIVVSGGKMGKEKGTDKLICAVEELHSQYPQVRLVLFGKFEDDMTEAQANNSIITSVQGWCNRTKTLELLKMANIACWPVHHTTLIEDAVAVCTPIITRKTGTSEHLIDGNGAWIGNGTKEEIKNAIYKILIQSKEQKKELYYRCEKMKQNISYHTIAKRVIKDANGFKK